MRLLTLLVLGLAVVSIGACAKRGPKRLTVVASIVPLGELVSAVLGDQGDVEILLPAGQSEHDFTLTPRQIVHMHEADAVVQIGLGLEGFMARTVEQLRREQRIVLSAADALPREELCHISVLRPEEVGSGHDHHHHHHDHGQCDAHMGNDSGAAACEDASGHAVSVDPHVWLDPVYAGMIVEYLAKRLGEGSPGRAEVFAANAKAFRAKLDQLDQETRGALARGKVGPVVTFHDAYRYLFHRYGVPLAAVVRIDPERNPTPQELAALISLLKGGQVKAIFTEPQFASSVLETLQREHPLARGELDPLGVWKGNGEGYLALIRANSAALLASAGQP